MKALVSLLTVVFSVNHALAAETCASETISHSCSMYAFSFVLSVAPSTNDCDPESMVFRWNIPGFPPKILAGIPVGFYENVHDFANSPSLCKTNSSQYPIFKVAPSLAMMVLRNNRMVFGVDISVALFNVQTGEVIEVKALGTTRHVSTGVVKTSTGFKIQLIRHTLREVNCDCDAGIEYGWMEFSFFEGKILNQWL